MMGTETKGPRHSGGLVDSEFFAGTTSTQLNQQQTYCRVMTTITTHPEQRHGCSGFGCG